MVNSNRLILVDALRGFALVGIVLIHSVEHFDFFYNTEFNFLFSEAMDRKIMRAIFFLISGKAYSIFAIMFGFSFYIQMKRQEEKGIDFRWGFLWRLAILLLFGIAHSLIYKGDILHMYALLGIPLVFLDMLNTKSLVWITILLALQIPSICKLTISFIHPQVEFGGIVGSNYWHEANVTFATGNFWEVIKFNLWKGRVTTWGWTYSNGRYLQLVALFIAGLIFGRKKYFEEIVKYKKNILALLVASVAISLALFSLGKGMAVWNLTQSQRGMLGTLLGSYSALASTGIVLFSFILLYLKFSEKGWVSLLANYGKMSLSNYILQALFGVVFFYGFGLGMYRFMGSSFSLLYGILFVFLQLMVSKYWMRRFYYGPLEWIWRAITYFNFSIKFRREKS